MASMPIITAEEMAVYRAAARQQQEREELALMRRQEHAWNLAKCAAVCLKTQYGASRVVVFGSLVREGCFTPWSDVDIAAWGLVPQDTFRAIGAVMDLDANIQMNLVDIHTCHSELWASIEREGIEM